MAAMKEAAETMIDLMITFQTAESCNPTESMLYSLRNDIKIANSTTQKLDKKIEKWTREYNLAVVKAQTTPGATYPFNPANDAECTRQLFMSTWFVQHAEKIKQTITDMSSKIYGYSPANDPGVDSVLVQNKAPSAYEARQSLIAAMALPDTTTNLTETLRYASEAKCRLETQILARDVKLQTMELSREQRIAWKNKPRLEGSLAEIDEGQRFYVRWFVLQIAKIEDKLKRSVV